jgi:hypothetical protein
MINRWPDESDCSQCHSARKQILTCQRAILLRKSSRTRLPDNNNNLELNPSHSSQPFPFLGHSSLDSHTSDPIVFGSKSLVQTIGPGPIVWTVKSILKLSFGQPHSLSPVDVVRGLLTQKVFPRHPFNQFVAIPLSRHGQLVPGAC